MPTAQKRITERVNNPFEGCEVDREHGIIRGVLLCGLKSENNRDYLPASFGVKKYEGVPVNFDHESTGVADVGGIIKNESRDSQGRPRGDYHALMKHPTNERVFEAAEKGLFSLYGFSHVAVCKTSVRNGREVVEDVSKVESVDLVRRPATTKGLFEHTEKPKVKLSQVAEKLGTASAIHGKILKSVVESVGDLEVAESADSDSPDCAAKGAMVQGMHGLADQLGKGEIDHDDYANKHKQLVNAHKKLSDKPEEGDKEDPEKKAKDKAEKEAVQAKAETASLKECLTIAAKHKLPTSSIESLLKVNSEAREEFATALAKAEAASATGGVQSAGREGAKTLEESDRLKAEAAAKLAKEAQDAAPDGEGFARLIEAKK